jgi:uncharacterized protein YacL
MIVLAVVGWHTGLILSTYFDPTYTNYIVILGIVAGGALGLVIAPTVTLRPWRWLEERIHQVPAHDLVAATVGLIIGLIISALLVLPLSQLPDPLGRILPAASAAFFGFLGMVVLVARQRDILGVIGRSLPGQEKASVKRGTEYIILDTSAIIDGRIADISQTGFLSGTLLIPRFVLNELQHIADSPDALRRNRGRRGLDMLNKLQKDSKVPIQISEIDIEGVADVDSKLIRLAKNLHCSIVTNDFNLNRVAELQGVHVLNINELANAVKSVVLPGEELTIHIIQEGKEPGQGVGYLDDGTMVVVENGRKYIGTSIDVVVTRVLQTIAGRMIFAHPKTERESG